MVTGTPGTGPTDSLVVVIIFCVESAGLHRNSRATSSMLPVRTFIVTHIIRPIIVRSFMVRLAIIGHVVGVIVFTLLIFVLVLFLALAFVMTLR